MKGRNVQPSSWNMGEGDTLVVKIKLCNAIETERWDLPTKSVPVVKNTWVSQWKKVWVGLGYFLDVQKRFDSAQSHWHQYRLSAGLSTYENQVVSRALISALLKKSPTICPTTLRKKPNSLEGSIIHSQTALAESPPTCRQPRAETALFCLNLSTQVQWEASHLCKQGKSMTAIRDV